jgi:hypothetical protein
MFHCIDDDGKRSYAAAAHRATRPGAGLLISCFSDANPSNEEWPHLAVSEQTLRDVLDGAGTLNRWNRPRCAAKWTAVKSRWRSGT